MLLYGPQKSKQFPRTPKLSKCNTGGLLNNCKRGLKRYNSWDLRGPPTPSPRTPCGSMDPQLRTYAVKSSSKSKWGNDKIPVVPAKVLPHNIQTTICTFKFNQIPGFAIFICSLKISLLVIKSKQLKKTLFLINLRGNICCSLKQTKSTS